jgi:negative regulator of sigma E activity
VAAAAAGVAAAAAVEVQGVRGRSAIDTMHQRSITDVTQLTTANVCWAQEQTVSGF